MKLCCFQEGRCNWRESYEAEQANLRKINIAHFYPFVYPGLEVSTENDKCMDSMKGESTCPWEQWELAGGMTEGGQTPQSEYAQNTLYTCIKIYFWIPIPCRSIEIYY